MALPINLASFPVVIAAGASLSAPVAIGAAVVTGLLFPAGWSAAMATFQVSVDGVGFVEFADAALNPVSVALNGGGTAVYVGLDSTLWRGVNLFKLRSGTLAMPVVQGAGAVVTLVGRTEEW